MTTPNYDPSVLEKMPLCQARRWDPTNPFNRSPHVCGLALNHEGSHRCGQPNGAGNCTFEWADAT